MELRDTQRPTLHLAASISGSTVTALHVGTVDIGTGIDPSSLRVCVAPGGDTTCTPLSIPNAEMHGVLTVSLDSPLDNPATEVRVRVADMAGNINEFSRTVAWLLNSPPAPPMGPDRDAGPGSIPNPDGSIMLPDGGVSDGAMLDGALTPGGEVPDNKLVCGCRMWAARSNQGPGYLLALLLMTIGLRRALRTKADRGN